MRTVIQPFTKRTGEILRFSQIFISRHTGEVKYTFKEIPVLLSNAENIVYLNEWNKFALLNQQKYKKSEIKWNHVLNEVDIRSENYKGLSSLKDYEGVYAQCYSFASKKVNDRRVKNALSKYLAKEYGAFSRMVDALKGFNF